MSDDELDHHGDSSSKHVPNAHSPAGQNDFEHGLCSCFTNCDICICSFCCPCIQFGMNWEKLNPQNEPDPSSVFIMYCLSYFLIEVCVDPYLLITSTLFRWWGRVQFRKALGYRERPVCDFIVALCCSCCMLAQDGNEIKAFKEGKLNR